MLAELEKTHKVHRIQIAGFAGLAAGPNATGEILPAIRDELMSRDFDEPGAWWPHQPGVVGGRDRQAGGSWCVSDVTSGVTALVLNRTERRTGSPSRGVLPLLATAFGSSWPAEVAVRT